MSSYGIHIWHLPQLQDKCVSRSVQSFQRREIISPTLTHAPIYTKATDLEVVLASSFLFFFPAGPRPLALHGPLWAGPACYAGSVSLHPQPEPISTKYLGVPNTCIIYYFRPSIHIWRGRQAFPGALQTPFSHSHLSTPYRVPPVYLVFRSLRLYHVYAVANRSRY